MRRRFISLLACHRSLAPKRSRTPGLVSVVAFTALLSGALVANAASFTDVSGTPYETAFTYLSQKGVISGYATGEGKPNGPLNRAEALKVIVGLRFAERVEWYKQNLMPMPLFADMDQREWYAPYIEAAFEEDLITGYPDRTFRPGNYLTAEEAVTMVLRAYGVLGSGDGARLSEYIQNRDSEWFTPYINAAIEKNLIMHQGRLELGQVMTRGRFFDLVYRLDKVQTDGSLAYRGPEPLSPVQARLRPQVVQSVPRTSNQTSQGTINAPQTATVAQNSYASEKYFSLSMPSLGVSDLTVTHPVDPFTSDGILQPLQYGVGHLFSYPGAGGKIMIYGHSSGYPWDVSQYTKIFRKVNNLSTGDRIFVTYDGKLFTYEVNYKQTVSASDTSPFNDSGNGEELILYTCWPPDSISQRYLVHAVPVNAVAAR
ncbi:MAG: S-layer homology domain-containing protein [Patescibacteria group bacterium]